MFKDIKKWSVQIFDCVVHLGGTEAGDRVSYTAPGPSSSVSWEHGAMGSVLGEKKGFQKGDMNHYRKTGPLTLTNGFVALLFQMLGLFFKKKSLKRESSEASGQGGCRRVMQLRYKGNKYKS